MKPRDDHDKAQAAAMAGNAIDKLLTRANAEGVHPFVRRNLIECSMQIAEDAAAIIFAPAPTKAEEG